ncbi:MAG: hypothetical protein Q4A72_04620 [Bacillota bacterium]|nr:hypothetical protein [Bacillota bacterium]
MTWFEFFIVLVILCVVSFFIRIVWVKGIDFLLSLVKRAFGLHKKEEPETWHSLEEIRKHNQK